MSANTIRLSIPVHVVAAFAVGCAAAAGCGAASASLMVARGLGLSAAGPLATGAICAGSLVGGWVLALLQKSRGLLWGGMLGTVYALALLGIQLAQDTTPDPVQLVRLGLMILAGAVGGYAGTLRNGKRRHHQ